MCGTLHSVDQYLNLKLKEVTVNDGDKHPHMVSSIFYQLSEVKTSYFLKITVFFAVNNLLLT